MAGDILGAAAAAAAILLAVLTVLGLLIRYALLPYLKEHLLEPVAETNKQVTVNHHSSETPTVLDRIDDVSKEVRLAHAEVLTLARMFDGHLDWSQGEVDRLWSELKRKRNR